MLCDEVGCVLGSMGWVGWVVCEPMGVGGLKARYLRIAMYPFSAFSGTACEVSETEMMESLSGIICLGVGCSGWVGGGERVVVVTPCPTKKP